jgi:hypothetical protein
MFGGQLPRIRVTRALTVNLGNYNSSRVELTVEQELLPGVELAEGVRVLWAEVSAELAHMIDRAKSEGIDIDTPF